MSRAIVRRIGARKQGAETRRERCRRLLRGFALGHEQRTPFLGTRCIRYQCQFNRRVSQRGLDSSMQGFRGEFVLLAGSAIRRCELGDARQLEGRKTIRRGCRVEVVYES